MTQLDPSRNSALDLYWCCVKLPAQITLRIYSTSLKMYISQNMSLKMSSWEEHITWLSLGLLPGLAHCNSVACESLMSIAVMMLLLAPLICCGSVQCFKHVLQRERVYKVSSSPSFLWSTCVLWFNQVTHTVSRCGVESVAGSILHNQPKRSYRMNSISSGCRGMQDGHTS